MRRFAIGLGAAFVLALCARPAAAQDDLAALCPADTFFYLEADGGALIEAIPTLQLMKLAGDPQVSDFIRPTLDKLGLDPKNPAASLVKMARLREYLPGKMAVGIRGLKMEVPQPDGTTEVFEISPGKPIDAKLVYRLMGLYFTLEANRQPAPFPRLTLDAVAAVDPGPELKKLVAAGLDSLGDALVRKKLKIGEADVVHLKLDADRLGVAEMSVSELFVHFGEKRWLLATTKSGLTAALAGGPRASLATSPRLAAARKRFTGGKSILFAYADLEYLVDVFQKLVPPIVYDMNEINGLASLRAFGLGVSISEGGVRESFGIVLDGDPKGVWTLLDALPGGLKSLDFAPPGALASFSVKFDGRILLDRIRAVTKEVLPGAEKEIERELAGELKKMGLDLHKDVLAGLGDEMAVFVFPPQMGPIPQVVIGVDVEDEAAFARLLAKAKQELAASGEAQIRPLTVNKELGIEGFQVFAQVPMSPSFCVHRGRFFGASSPDLLKKVCENWGTEGAKTMRKDGRVFGSVLKGLNGGEADNLAMLGYVNVQGIVPIAAQFLPMVQGEIPEGWLDLTKVPNVPRMAKHLNGIAMGLRNDKHGLTLDAYSPAGFIVPMTAIALVMDAERQRERRARAARGVVIVQARNAWLGVNAKASSGKGVEVLRLVENGPAHKAGLKLADVIVAADGIATPGIDDLDQVMAKKKPGDVVKLKVRRGKTTFEVVVTAGNRQAQR